MNVTMFPNIILNENDVPGAKFRLPNVEDHSVLELKRWLECRGLPKTGRKADLIVRCKNCISVGNANVIDVSVDKGKWYELKVSGSSGINTTTTVDASGITTAQWQPFPSVDIPKHFNKGHIYHYLVESAPHTSTATYNTSDEEDSNSADQFAITEKPFRRGEQYVISNHVMNLYDCKIDDQYKLKAKVKSSFRDNKYDVVITISYNSGVIKWASCKCKQSALGRCSHVSALLLLLLKHVDTHGYSALACTSKPCQWDQGSQKKIPQQVNIATYQHIHSRTSRAEHDPRPTIFQQAEVTIFEQNNFLAALEGANDNVPSLWQQILKYKYEDFTYSNEELENLRSNRDQFLNNLKSIVLNCEGVAMMVEGTELQTASDAWHRWRAVLITSSIAKKVLGLTEPSAKINFFRNHLWNISKIKTIQMRYGTLNEDIARTTYLQTIIAAGDVDAEVKTTGLWISKNYPFLGCSPDGIVSNSHGVGLLEIKCPKILENFEPWDFDKCLTAGQKQNFCLKIEDGHIILKTNHPYYFQIQLAMGIMGYPWCDFVVWAPKGIVLLKIFFNENVFVDVVSKLEPIYKNIFVPEYFAMRTPRELTPLVIL